ncbi:Golgin subfamily A member 3 [Triplophysa tibetana]|uniref:Golgin subfamily A member 3 n=1 Tax=Triplophysa tibetana TaxID=1572043 RepID=A0A5A9P4C2_9TELE|nr:Golgin subfamily A member 3 [Triplophysa tibetana]
MENGNAAVASNEATTHQPDTQPSQNPDSNTVESLKHGGLDLFSQRIPNGHVKSEPLPNGEATVEGQEPVGDTQPLATPFPGSLLSDSPLFAKPDPGVACFPDNLEKSEGSVHKGDALQSLRLSIPMQETELSSKEPSMEMENEEKIRQEARRRLEEQLKQYRVQRHKERTHRSTPKSRQFSTLDPELMLHPEDLPRASTVAMTKEYSFLRTSVPRGPKLGSLGIPQTKEKRSKSSRSNKIHSLADYKSPESDTKNTEASGGAGSMSADASFTSLHSSISSVSTVSEISISSESNAHLEYSPPNRDSEVDGSESGFRVDGIVEPRSRRDSFSSSVSYGSSVMGTHDEMLQVGVAKNGANYSISGNAAELNSMMRPGCLHHALCDVDSISQAIYLGINLDEFQDYTYSPLTIGLSLKVSFLQDVLTSVRYCFYKHCSHVPAPSESTYHLQALIERTELQAQLATVSARLQGQVEQTNASQERQTTLTSEVTILRSNCSTLEKAMVDLQASLEGKNASLASLGNDLQVAEEQYQRLMGKVEEMQLSLNMKDNAVSDLRQQMGGLQTQLQRVQSERNALQSRLKTSQAEVDSLQQLRLWYQQQLTMAQEARVQLQGEMANVQAGQMTQIGVLENLKMENVTLSHQLTETKHRSIKEKERIAVQLQNIEVDMLTQEAAIHQIQEAKTMVEEDLHHKLEEFEEERENLIKLANTATTLERELEQVKLTLSQKDAQLESFQLEHLELMKQLTATQENLQTKGQALNQLEARYQELQVQLEELQTDATAKDETLQYLQNEKIILEVALQAARADKSELDEGAERLGEGVLVASEMLDQLRQEVQVKATQIESLQQENGTLKKQAQKLKEQFTHQKVMVEAYRRDASSKDQLISELKASKKRLVAEVKDLKQELLRMDGEKKSAEQEQARLLKEVERVQQQMNGLENHLQSVQTERDQLDCQLQSFQFDQSQLAAVTEENENLRKRIEQMQDEARKSISEQKVKMKRLGTNLTSAQKDVKAKHKAYENAVGILSRRLQETLTAKETAEAELEKVKARVSQGGNSQELQSKVESLQRELKAVSQSKAMLEKELQEVITLTSTELEEYQEKVMELEDELQESRNFKKRIRRLEDANKKLVLELEHEKGKLSGLGKSHSALREHANILEAALAKREADLVQLNLQVQAVLKRKEEEDQQMRQLVQTLQAALEKEKIKVKDLTEQVAEANLEAAHNRRHYRAAMLELSEIKKDLQAKEKLVKALQKEAKTLTAQDEKRSEEVARFQEELDDAHEQLQILQKQLDDELNKQPLTNQEVEDLKWEVEQRQREIETQKQQLEMVEQCHQREMDSVQDTLQRIKVELEMVQEELNGTRKDKFMLQAKVVELRNTMKTVLQQNNQLKQDLKNNKMRKRMELKGESTPVTPVKIPDCPVPASLLDELLRPSTSVNKEPLNNLHNCLKQLKLEMDSLQKQMEEHTVTVTSLSNAEDQLHRLGLHDNSKDSSSKEENGDMKQEMQLS